MCHNGSGFTAPVSKRLITEQFYSNNQTGRQRRRSPLTLPGVEEALKMMPPSSSSSSAESRTRVSCVPFESSMTGQHEDR